MLDTRASECLTARDHHAVYQQGAALLGTTCEYVVTDAEMPKHIFQLPAIVIPPRHGGFYILHPEPAAPRE